MSYFDGVKSKAKSSRNKKLSHYQSGGNVEPIRMDRPQIQSALERLERAGMLNKPAARDFVAARAKRMGYNPVEVIGQEAKYKKGGRLDRKSRGR